MLPIVLLSFCVIHL